MPESANSGTLQVEGWGVATLDLERRWTRYGDAIPDRVFLFRSPDLWSLLVVRLTDRDDVDDRVARASVSVRRFASTLELRRHVEDAYVPGSWYDLADAGRDEEALFIASLDERVARDFNRASVIDKDLAFSVGSAGEEVLGLGRRLPGWRRLALNAISVRLVEMGFEVVSLDPAEASVPALGREVGEVVLRGYGVEIPGVVQVDPFGEVYIRLPDDATFCDDEVL
jgi:hypothetical protein